MICMFDETWFAHIIRPSRYIGGEINLIKKKPGSTEVSVVLAFPDVYEVGMSHLGLKLLYHILNARSWIAAERAFAPWVDLENELKNRSIPLATLESGRPLRTFDIVGFSIQHELCYTTILNMLALSRIPLLASQRTQKDPLVIAGGPACFNPEPMAEFFDAMVIGDGEEATLEICRSVKEEKKRKRSHRKGLISRLRHIKGVYVPSLFSVHYASDGSIEAIEPTKPDYKKVEKAIVSRIDDYPFPESQVVPFTGLVHDRLSIEISRGCTRGCRFCQAGMIYRPVRERSPDSIIEKAEKALRLTGYDDLSLLSLSSGDYSCIEPLLKILMDTQARKNVAVSLPSLRVDSLRPALIDQIKRVRKTGFTLAPEAGNDRMRRVINKGLTQEDILQMATAVYGAGWNLIKLYFMIGLPMEEEDDLQDIVNLAREVIRCGGKGERKHRLNVSVATFVPKAHTPFMWSPQISLTESKKRLRFIRDALRGSRVRVKWNHPEMSWLEGIFARGDRRLSKTVIRAWKQGARFDAWSEHFKLELWEEALQATGIDPGFYLHRERSMRETMPWDHINSGVSTSFLIKEWHRAEKGQVTPDCRHGCLECGVCDHKAIDPVIFNGWNGTSRNVADEPLPPHPSKARRYRLSFTKLDRARYLSHLELVRVFIRAFNRSGINLVYSKGFHPMPKLSFAYALPVGTESMEETVDIEFTNDKSPSRLMEELNCQLPKGIAVTSVKELPPGQKRAKLEESHFLITLNGIRLERQLAEKFVKSKYFPIKKITRKGERVINARALVKTLDLVSPNSIRLVLKHGEGPELKPMDIVRGVFSLSENQWHRMKIIKTAQVLSHPSCD